jgi:uncharacterized protein (TIGR03083 family)
MTIDHPRYVADLSQRLGELVAADPSRPIPECPGWTARDVLGHVGRVYAMVAAILERQSLDMLPPGPEAEIPDHDIDEWFAERRRAVCSSIESTDPVARVWTWGKDRTAAFYRRRMVHETAVHLADVERANGTELELDRDVCLDGIDEYFEEVLPFSLARRQASPPRGSLHLHATDGPGEWMVRVEKGGISLSHEHAKGDVAWRGPARSLYFAVWGRWSTDIESLGDGTISDAWRKAAP